MGLSTQSEQQERYQRLFSSHAYGFWEWDPCNDEVLLSGAFWCSQGYEVDPNGQRFSMEEVVPFLHRADSSALLKEATALLSTGEQLASRVRVYDPNGTQRCFFLDGSVTRGSDDSLNYVTGIVLDYTVQQDLEEKLLESEQRHHRIINASNDGIWEWNRETDGFHFSDNCWRQLGYADTDSSISSERSRLETWQASIHPEDLKHFNSSLSKHLRGEDVFDIEYRIKDKEGCWKWIRARGQAEFDKSGPLRMSGTNMDISHIKEFEAKLLQAKEEAEKANQAKSEFLSSMSHELRTPLNAILGYTQLFAMDTNLSANQQQSVREIRKAGNHLLQLISDVLDLSKVESGQMSLSVEPVLAKRVVDESLTLVQPLAEAKRVELSCDDAGLAEAYVSADAVRLKQAVVNLLGNAIKYNREGGRVDVIFSRNGSEHLRIEVRDTGVGIPKTRQAEVFEPFNRLGAEGSTVEGSGVGLVITKQLVEMMGGDLSFVSKEGEGSSFWVQLPCVADWSNVDLSAGPAKDEKSQGLRAVGERSVLYVEDNPSNTRLMEQLFQRFPTLHLETANEAFFGLYKARTSEPDLIILDINLPGMDGFEALSVLQRDPLTQNIPVIALSANAMQHDVERGMQAGFLEYLTKPLDVERLIAVFNQLWDLKTTSQ